MIKKQTRNRCRAKAKSGQPCQAAPTAGGLCFFHANPNKAAELGRRGGRKNRHVVATEKLELPANLNTAQALLDTNARLVAAVWEERIKPQTASAVATLLNLQLRVIGTAALEAQVAEVEEQLRQPAANAQAPSQRTRGCQ